VVNRSLDDDTRNFLRSGAYLAVVDGVHRFANDDTKSVDIPAASW
jgi:hypothetical protein